ncbi:Nif3-like dinuclear metal center hexameric protein [Candidatus Woesearchaeota archaeon]|nr:Nif3-like dinuclear metal center hexameric protein [Candidatus Woesearchaeota archaeon]
MSSLLSVVRFLNKELNIRKIPDSSRNGLQVKGKKQVKKIGFAVDACLSTFEKAKKAKVDLLIVHHGLLWKPQKRKEITKKRLNFLKKNKIALYGCHLPLDAHIKHGNNIKLCELIHLTKIKKFGRYHGGPAIGYQGSLINPKTIKALANLLNKELKTESKVYPFGKKKIKTVAIISGAGYALLEEAIKKKIDLFITGEIKYSIYNHSKDEQISLIVAGHYATETLGIKALMALIKEKFNIQTVFIDNPIEI